MWSAIGQRGAVVLAASGTLLLGACGGDDQAADEPEATVTVTETASPSPTQPSTPTDDDTAGGDDGTPGAAAGLPPRPGRGECVEVAVPRQGRYRVYDAGLAVVRREGDRLLVGAVRANAGWNAQVTERGGDDDVEIEFRPSGTRPVLELEVELDDGRVEPQICADDDDGDDQDD
jgi:hypothetical protein